jgi:adenosylcobinamide-phosphate synthase
MDKALLVVSALLISAALGGRWSFISSYLESKNIPDPWQLAKKLLRDTERKLNRPTLKPAEQNFRGTMLTMLTLAASLVVGLIFNIIPNHFILILIFLVISLPAGSSWHKANAIKKQLQIANLPAARAQFDKTPFLYHAVMDAGSLARSAIEYLAVQFSENILSPIFWFMLLGVPGLFASIAINILQEILSGPDNKPFGKTARDMQVFVNYIPARIAAFLWVLSVYFLPSGSGNGYTLANKISKDMPSASPHHLALLCSANGLSLTLGGRTSPYVTDKWVGNGRIEAGTADITRAQFIFTLQCLFIFVGLGFFI